MRLTAWLGAMVVAALVVFCAPAWATGGQTLLSEPFTGSTTNAPVAAVSVTSGSYDTQGFPCLTAGPDTAATPLAGCGLQTPDTAGQGALRLTDATDWEASGALYDATFPSSEGLDIRFDQYQYGGDGADGITFALASAPPLPTAIGGPGAGLGYAPLNGAGGFPFGYLGVGLDVYGNYSTTGDDGSGCPTDPTWAGFHPNEVTVRGSGDGDTGYCLLGSSLAMATDPMGSSGIQLHGADRASGKRGVEIKIDPSPKAPTFTVGIDPSGGTNYTPVASGPLPADYFDPSSGQQVEGIPSRLTFAFVASTGASDDIHEITDVTATTLNGAVPELSLTDTDDHGGTVAPGGTITRTLTAGVATGSPAPESQPITVTDTLPAGEQLASTPAPAGWDCTKSTPTQLSCTSPSNATVGAGTTLPPIPATVTVTGADGQAPVDAAQAVSDDAAAPVSASDPVTIATQTTTSTPTTTTASTTATATTSTASTSVTATGSATTPSKPATATTSAAPGVTTAALTATVTANGLSTTGHFEYGLDPAYFGGGAQVYDTVTPNVAVPPDGGAHTLTQHISGLVPHARYHARFVAANAAGTTTSPDFTFTTRAVTAAPAPVLGRSADAAPVSGRVLVRLPGRGGTPHGPGQQGQGFVPLTQLSQLPAGALIDARHGALKMTFALPASRATQVITLSAGVFTFAQARAAALRGLTTFTLAEGAFSGGPTLAACTAKGGGSRTQAHIAKLSSKVLQTLRATENRGRFRSRGHYGAGTVRGTAWSTSDRCDGTLFAVSRGAVSVQDFLTRRTILVSAGHSHLSPAGRA